MRKTVYVIFALAMVLALLPTAVSAQDLTRTREVQGTICCWSSLTVTPNPQTFDDFTDLDNYFDVNVTVSTNYRRDWELTVDVEDISTGASRTEGYMYSANANQSLTNPFKILGPATSGYQPLTSPVQIVDEDMTTRHYTSGLGDVKYCQCIAMDSDYAGDYNIYLRYAATIEH